MTVNRIIAGDVPVPGNLRLYIRTNQGQTCNGGTAGTDKKNPRAKAQGKKWDCVNLTDNQPLRDGRRGCIVSQ